MDVGVGVIAAVCLALWRPMAWPIGLGIGVGLASFGTWGIAEREIQERVGRGHEDRRVVRVFRAVQAISIVAGLLAVLIAGFILLGIALGTIIS